MTETPRRLHYLEHLARLGAVDVHPGGKGASVRLLETLAPVAGERVLEIGCGAGRTMLRVAETSGVAVYGVDPLQAMLAAARARIRRAEVEGRAVLVRADGSAGLPFADASFDRAYAESVLGFQSATEAGRLLGDVWRVLTPGGRFVANEAVWRDGTERSTVSSIYESSVRDFGLAQASAEGWTVEDWTRCMQEAGFAVRAVEPLARGSAPSPTRGGASSRRGTATALLLRARALLNPRLLRAELEYRRRLGRHRDDGRHVEAYLFVLERPATGGDA